MPAGSGGSVSLVTYAALSNGTIWSADPSQAQVVSAGNVNANVAPTGSTNGVPNEPDAASITLGGTILAAGFNNDGSLTLQAPGIQIGGTTSVISGPGHDGQITLPAVFFADNQFSSYTLTSTFTGISVTVSTQVVLQQANEIVPSTIGQEPTGADPMAFAALGINPLGLRPATNLTLTQIPFGFDAANAPNAASANNAGILVDSGASIIADPQASISLTAGGPVTLLGSIIAPAGSISLTNNFSGASTTNVSNAAQDVFLGPNAVLDADGVFLPNPTIDTISTGTELAGGAINLAGGTIIVLPGATIDIAGASGIVDEPNAVRGFNGAFGTPQFEWSNGGSLTLIGSPTSGRGADSLFFAGRSTRLAAPRKPRAARSRSARRHWARPSASSTSAKAAMSRPAYRRRSGVPPSRRRRRSFRACPAAASP